MITKWVDKLYLKFLQKNEFESKLLREYFIKKFNIEIGLYSYGCFNQYRIARNTKIGRYCSFAGTSRRFNANHGIEFISTHAYLYNTTLDLVDKETIKRTECTISDDVWVGHNAIILSGVGTIGRGAIIGAGAVVTKDVPPYAIVGGNPAKVIKFRFDSDVIKKIEKTKWWLLNKDELQTKLTSNRDLFFKPTQYFNKTI